MIYDFVVWDDEDDASGNVIHIEAADLTPREVEEVLNGPGSETKSRAHPYHHAKFGWTNSGKYIFVTYKRSEEAGIVVIEPVTAFEVEPRLP